MFDWFQKMLTINAFYVTLVKILHLEKKHIISISVCLSLILQEKMWLINTAQGRRELGGGGVCNKKR